MTPLPRLGVCCERLVVEPKPMASDRVRPALREPEALFGTMRGVVGCEPVDDRAAGLGCELRGVLPPLCFAAPATEPGTARRSFAPGPARGVLPATAAFRELNSSRSLLHISIVCSWFPSVLRKAMSASSSASICECSAATSSACADEQPLRPEDASEPERYEND